jgi:predicted RecA/RadA family phage recombinase
MARVHQLKGDTIDHTPSGAVAAGTMVAIGTGMIGIADRPIPANAKGSLAVTGCWYVDKATGASTDFAVGTKLYLNTSTGKVTSSADSGGATPTVYPPVGIVLVAPATGDELVLVRLSH